MLFRSKILDKEFPRIQYMILKSPSISQDKFDRLIPSGRKNIVIVDNKTYEGIYSSDICMVCSGTATLETAVLEKPMVVVYKTSLFTWLLAKLFVKIPNIGMVNVVAGKRVVPECVQHQATGKNIAKELKNIFTNELKVSDMKDELRKIKTSLGSKHSADTAAKEILHFLK